MKPKHQRTSSNLRPSLGLRFFHGEGGVLTMEWIFLLGILVIGIIGGLVVMRDSVHIQCANLSNAVGATEFSYDIPKYTSHATINGIDPAYIVNRSNYDDQENPRVVLGGSEDYEGY